MVIRGKKPGDYENPLKVEQRTWRKVLFVQSIQPIWWFLYDVEEKKDDPWKIGWLHERKLPELSIIGAFTVKNGEVREVRQDLLRIVTGYHPLLNRDPNGLNKKDGRKGLHSRNPLPKR